MSAASHEALDQLELVTRLRLAVARLHRQLRSQQVDDLGMSAHSALFCIGREGPLSLGSLAAREQLVPSMITKLVDQLEGEGLVQREESPDDGRVRVVRITPAGRDRIQSIRTRREAWLAQQIDALAPAEIAQLHSVIDILEHLATGESQRNHARGP